MRRPMRLLPLILALAVPAVAAPSDEQTLTFYMMARASWHAQRVCAASGSPHAPALKQAYLQLVQRHSAAYMAGQKALAASEGTTTTDVFEKQITAETDRAWAQLSAKQKAEQCAHGVADMKNLARMVDDALGPGSSPSAPAVQP